MTIKKLKDLIDEKCRYRVADFEIAQVKAAQTGLRVIFSSFIYHEPTPFIWKVIGVVQRPNRDRLRVEWDFEGRATIAGERTPEFDLKLCVL
ncbi:MULTISPECIES: hypothetical protein [Sanguibacteroides]|nr:MULTISPECIES: hypothetical protein [Sanguibacteroides]